MAEHPPRCIAGASPLCAAIRVACRDAAGHAAFVAGVSMGREKLASRVFPVAVALGRSGGREAENHFWSGYLSVRRAGV